VPSIRAGDEWASTPDIDSDALTKHEISAEAHAIWPGLAFIEAPFRYAELYRLRLNRHCLFLPIHLFSVANRDYDYSCYMAEAAIRPCSAGGSSASHLRLGAGTEEAAIEHQISRHFDRTRFHYRDLTPDADEEPLTFLRPRISAAIDKL
jgi:hypothetical protein